MFVKGRRISVLPGNLRIPAFFILIVVSLNLSAQSDSTKSYKALKNTIRINVTNPLLFGNDFTLIGYERVLNKHHTASVSIGKIGFPTFLGIDFDSIKVAGQTHDKGFNMSFDYRFYLRKENKYGPPRGVYVGPYYAFNRFSRDLTWDMNTEGFNGQAISSFVLTANLVGVQMGYQFVLWNRLAIDMILIGPGGWFFNLKSDFETTLSDEDEALLLEKLNEMVKDKFPGSDLVIKGGGFEAKRSTTTGSVGFRYMINLGFRF